MYPHLVMWFRSAKTKDEKMTMRVCAGKTLAIWGEFAVENSPMTLALNLDWKHTTPNA